MYWQTVIMVFRGGGGGRDCWRPPPKKKGGWGGAVKDMIQPAEKKSEEEKKKSKMSTFKNIFCELWLTGLDVPGTTTTKSYSWPVTWTWTVTWTWHEHIVMSNTNEAITWCPTQAKTFRIALNILSCKPSLMKLSWQFPSKINKALLDKILD